MYLPTVPLVNAILSLTHPRREERNGGIHLAVNPRCGSLTGDYADVNAGVWPEAIKTVVSFGDSYTDGGRDDGGPLAPPILYPPNSLAGGRSTNGLTWVEHVANDLGAEIKDYAESAACIDLSLWPSNPKPVDFIGQMKTFLGQNNNLDPETTLYSIFFGINDYLASLIDGDHMQEAAQRLLQQIEILSSPPTNGRYFVVLDDYGRGDIAPQGEAYKQTVFNGLRDFHTRTNGTKLGVSYVDFYSIWHGVLSQTPGYQAFGYNSTDACAASYPWCDDPNGYFYWISGHPSNTTHRIMADFVDRVWTECRVW